MRRVGHKPQAPKVDEFVVFLKNQSQKFLPNGKKRVFLRPVFFLKNRGNEGLYLEVRLNLLR